MSKATVADLPRLLREAAEIAHRDLLNDNLDEKLISRYVTILSSILSAWRETGIVRYADGSMDIAFGRHRSSQDDQERELEPVG
jgi:hypothetical protein